MKRPLVHTRRTVFHSVFLLSGCLVLTGFAVSGILSQFPKERAYRERAAEKGKELERLQTAHAELAARVAYTESEGGREAYVRQSFDVARPGEMLVILPESAKDAAPTIATSTQHVEEAPPTWLAYLMFWR